MAISYGLIVCLAVLSAHASHSLDGEGSVVGDKRPKTVNERKKLERKRNTEAGFKRKEIWVHETQLDMFEQFKDSIKKP